MPVTINGTTGIVTPALVNGTALSFRNKIINGNFGINQRGYVSGTATSGANQYTLDRWRVVTSGQNLTFSASGTGNSVTAPAGGIEQVIESLNIEGGTYTLSWNGTATATINGSAIVNGGQATLPANTNATIKFSSGTVSLVQLEAGSVATPFENRPIGTELALCQRYYYRISPNASSKFLCSGQAASTTLFGSYLHFPIQMRTSPLAFEQSGTASDYQVYFDATSAVCNSIPTYSVLTTSYAAYLNCTISAGLTTGKAVTFGSNNANAYLGWSAEL